MAVKRKFKSDLITVVNGDFVEQLWVKIIVGGKSLYVCSVYLPPNCDALIYSLLEKFVKKKLQNR
jgi:hypothetical protein